jgi:hypothetical protein
MQGITWMDVAGHREYWDVRVGGVDVYKMQGGGTWDTGNTLDGLEQAASANC